MAAAEGLILRELHLISKHPLSSTVGMTSLFWIFTAGTILAINHAPALQRLSVASEASAGLRSCIVAEPLRGWPSCAAHLQVPNTG